MTASAIGSGSPRVLIVGIDPLQRIGAQGITVANLFSGWDPDALGQLVITDAAAPGVSTCGNSHQVASTTFPLEHAFRGLLQGVIRTSGPSTNKIGAVGVSSNEVRSLRVRMHLAARAINDLEPCRLSETTVRWIREFKPEVIYSCLGNARLMKVAIAASEAAGDIPIIPHFMDDWPSTLYADGTLWSIPQKTTRKLLLKLFQHVPFGFCIGDAMAAEYKRRYQRDFSAFMNCVEDSEFTPSPVERKNSSRAELVWTYVGGLHLNRWKPLAAIAKCVSAQGGTLRIFAPEQDIRKHGDALSHLAGTQLSSLAPSDVMNALRDSNVLVHVESFDPDESAFTRLSVSTKLAQYLGSGRPILGFGPAGLASLQLIADASAGVTVTTNAPEPLADTMNKLAGDTDLRRKLSESGFAYAKEHFMKGAVCRRFLHMLEGASAMHKQHLPLGTPDDM
jgi:hypothetical protein